MYEELLAGLKAAQDDSTVSVVLLTGTGEYYSSGNDLSMFAVPPEQMGALATTGRALLSRFVHSFIDFPKPLIAAVNGTVSPHRA